VALTEHASDHYSQNGEDGILAELFRLLDVSTGYFVEFGAWDGLTYSNTYLLATAGWRGCYIEGDPERFQQLRMNVPQPQIHKICRFVQTDGPDSLDAILADVAAPHTFELLSIDIDGDDLAVWRGMQDFRPLCVVIEHNPTIPYDVSFINPPGRNWGNSARAIRDHAEASGYRLTAVTATNLIFVDERSQRDVSAVQPFRLEDAEPSSRFFWGYDGTLLRLGPEGVTAPEFYRVPWSDAVVPQPLPRSLRRFANTGGGFGVVRRSLMAVAAGLNRPIAALRAIVERARARKPG
jgi:hypothetical protein